MIKNNTTVDRPFLKKSHDNLKKNIYFLNGTDNVAHKYEMT
jgi:hypothetical protein